MALDAIAHGRWMDLAVDVGGVLVGMTGKAQCLRRRGRQLDAGDVAIRPNLVASCTAHRHGGMD